MEFSLESDDILDMNALNDESPEYPQSFSSTEFKFEPCMTTNDIYDEFDSYLGTTYKSTHGQAQLMDANTMLCGKTRTLDQMMKQDCFFGKGVDVNFSTVVKETRQVNNGTQDCDRNFGSENNAKRVKLQLTEANSSQVSNEIKKGGVLSLANKAKKIKLQTLKTPKSKENVEGDQRTAERPNITYPFLIAMSMIDASCEWLMVEDIYDSICSRFPFYKTAATTWKNNVRHALSNNKYFVKKPSGDERFPGRIFWGIDPAQRSAVTHSVKVAISNMSRMGFSLKCSLN